ncbi:hypothetical protein MVEN_01339200 [Mycena venus]|uniref:Uncharacterized protein n=1 Tax=Mycena venus TaxID=2733690 RepID=A0A8H6Y230_9AGAR|nr:hypothetical protein MVEN_01339200 [Mycena venus]
MKYTLPTEAVNTQRLAFLIIVDLLTLFPGLRLLFLRSKCLDGATSRESIAIPWYRPFEPMDEEWTFWKTLAATGLGDTVISAILEESSILELPDCPVGGLGAIEQLMVYHDCSNSAFYAALCIRYLGGILDLPGFWAEMDTMHLDVTKKLCDKMVTVLKDVGVDVVDDIVALEFVDDLGPFDYGGLDFLANTILVGISSWLDKLEQTEWAMQSWHSSFCQLLLLLRRQATLSRALTDFLSSRRQQPGELPPNYIPECHDEHQSVRVSHLEGKCPDYLNDDLADLNHLSDSGSAHSLNSLEEDEADISSTNSAAHIDDKTPGHSTDHMSDHPSDSSDNSRSSLEENSVNISLRNATECSEDNISDHPTDHLADLDHASDSASGHSANSLEEDEASISSINATPYHEDKSIEHPIDHSAELDHASDSGSSHSLRSLEDTAYSEGESPDLPSHRLDVISDSRRSSVHSLGSLKENEVNISSPNVHRPDRAQEATQTSQNEWTDVPPSVPPAMKTYESVYFSNPGQERLRLWTREKKPEIEHEFKEMKRDIDAALGQRVRDILRQTPSDHYGNMNSFQAAEEAEVARLLREGVEAEAARMKAVFMHAALNHPGEPDPTEEVRERIKSDPQAENTYCSPILMETLLWEGQADLSNTHRKRLELDFPDRVEALLDFHCIAFHADVNVLKEFCDEDMNGKKRNRKEFLANHRGKMETLMAKAEEMKSLGAENAYCSPILVETLLWKGMDDLPNTHRKRLELDFPDHVEALLEFHCIAFYADINVLKELYDEDMNGKKENRMEVLANRRVKMEVLMASYAEEMSASWAKEKERLRTAAAAQSPSA